MSYFFKYIKTNLVSVLKKNKGIYKKEYHLNTDLNKEQFSKEDINIIDTNTNIIDVADNNKLMIDNPNSLMNNNKLLNIENISTSSINDNPEINTIFKCNINIIGNDNILINAFLEKMKELNGGPRIIGRIYNYLYDPTNIQGTIEYIMSDIKWKGGVISEVFLSSIPILITELNSSSTIICESLLSYQSIMDSHFDLLDAWIKDRIMDCNVSEFTPMRWTTKYQVKLGIIKEALKNYHQIIISDKNIVIKELINRDILKIQYVNTDTIKPILEEIGHKSNIKYFPSHFNFDPTSYFDIPKYSIYSSTNEPPILGFNTPPESPTSGTFIYSGSLNYSDS
jgi:hypothetical protein